MVVGRWSLVVGRWSLVVAWRFVRNPNIEGPSLKAYRLAFPMSISSVKIFYLWLSMSLGARWILLFQSSTNQQHRMLTPKQGPIRSGQTAQIVLTRESVESAVSVGNAALKHTLHFKRRLHHILVDSVFFAHLRRSPFERETVRWIAECLGEFAGTPFRMATADCRRWARTRLPTTLGG